MTRYRSFRRSTVRIFFFFNDTATTEIYTLPLHDALPICRLQQSEISGGVIELSMSIAAKNGDALAGEIGHQQHQAAVIRSEEHTSELQSRLHLVCRLLLEKKKTPQPSSTLYRRHSRLIVC